jgi:exopolysaccharide production protein ExoZ
MTVHEFQVSGRTKHKSLEGRPEIITNIQGLRFIAAFGVCILHVGILNGELPGFLLGGAGVDLFFVISGFIMVVSSQGLFGRSDAPRRFFLRRLARVVPLYWLATIAYLSLQLWFGGLSLNPPTPDVFPRAIAGLFFLPITTREFYPLLPVGWTLNFEMMFYALFAVAIRFRQPIALMLVAATICIFAAIGLIFDDPPKNGFVAFVFNGTALEFAYGVGLGYLYERGWRLPALFAAAAFLCGFIALGFIMQWPGHDFHREFAIGIPAALIIFGAVSLPQIPAGRLIGRLVILLGDSSYALYLLHWILFWYVHWLPQAVLLGLAVAISIGIRVLIEKPILKLFRSKPRKPLSRLSPLAEL